MLIVNKKMFNRGLLLFVTFLCVFASLFMPIWGKGENGLNEADDLFNRLSKGSSYFIPAVQKELPTAEGKSITVTAKIKDADAKFVPVIVDNLKKAGAEASADGNSVTYSGDLGKILTTALADADDMFKDNGQAVLDRHGVAEKGAEKGITKAWWLVFDASIKPLQKQKLIQEAKLVNTVNKRGLEPGYNFYGVPAGRVMDSILPLTGLLVFYVIYTMWYGFAIFDMFAGIGLSMSKPKNKKEA
jgi:hypothetical protein